MWGSVHLAERSGTGALRRGAAAMSNAQQIVEALGGAENLVAVESCITRVRVEVADPAKVDEEGLREAGAFGVVAQGYAVQVVVGPVADDLVEEIKALR